MFETCSSSTARHVTFTYFPAVFVLERKYFNDVVKYIPKGISELLLLLLYYLGASVARGVVHLLLARHVERKK
jgi:hypothetical protein